jgi:GNAT superfamily N-acetyltransferase
VLAAEIFCILAFFCVQSLSYALVFSSCQFLFHSLQLLEALESFYVVERDGSIIACAALFPFPEEKSGEVAAIAVSEECRGRGQGDKLLGMFIVKCKPSPKSQVTTTILVIPAHMFLYPLSYAHTTLAKRKRKEKKRGGTIHGRK